MLVTPRRQLGFTLIELMTTITVLVVLTMVALPAFREFVANQRVRNASYNLMAALTLARSQAITLNGPVSLQKTGTAGWDAGWTVTDGTNIYTSQEALSNLSITDSSSLTLVTYGRDGRAITTSTQFTVQPPSTMSGVKTRCVSIGLGGLPTLKEGAC